MTSPTGAARVTVDAADKKAGMTFEELEANMARAKQWGYTGAVKMRLGFKGQVQSVTFHHGRT
jgi:myo-inositol-hexaphosphate 3-phosphohydrolase